MVINLYLFFNIKITNNTLFNLFLPCQGFHRVGAISFILLDFVISIIFRVAVIFILTKFFLDLLDPFF